MSHLIRNTLHGHKIRSDHFLAYTMPDVSWAAKKVIVMLVTIFSFLRSGSFYVFAAVADDIKANQNYT